MSDDGTEDRTSIRHFTFEELRGAYSLHLHELNIIEYNASLLIRCPMHDAVPNQACLAYDDPDEGRTKHVYCSTRLLLARGELQRG